MLGGAGLRHPSLRGPSGLLEEILLIEGAELQSSGGVLYSTQTTLPEASGQVDVEPAAVSWGWLLGAPCSLPARAEHENSCCDRLGTALLGVYLAPRAGGTSCLLGKKKMIDLLLHFGSKSIFGHTTPEKLSKSSIFELVSARHQTT